MKEWILYGNPKNESYNENDEKIEYCKDMINNDLAEVVVMFERPEFIRTKTSQRMAFADNLGVIGISNIKSNFHTKQLLMCDNTLLF